MFSDWTSPQPPEKDSDSSPEAKEVLRHVTQYVVRVPRLTWLQRMDQVLKDQSVPVFENALVPPAAEKTK